MTNPTPHGQVPAIQRYSIGYHSDEGGVRSLSPTSIYDDAGPWVRYEDHAAALCRLHAENEALRAQQPAPEYVGNGMFKGETIEKAAEHWANWCDVRCMTGLSEFLRVVAARAPADSVTAPAATPTAASIAWNALRDLTDPLGEAGVKIMGHVRIYAQRQYEAGLTEGRATPPPPPAKALAGAVPLTPFIPAQRERLYYNRPENVSKGATVALSDAKLWDLWNAQGTDNMSKEEAFVFARAIEAEVRQDALEEAAQLVEKATYRTRLVKAVVNGQAGNTQPCALAATIRKLKDDTQ